MSFLDIPNIIDFEPCTMAVKMCADACQQAPANEKKVNNMSRYYDEDLDCYVEGVQSDTTRSQNYFKMRMETIWSDQNDTLRTKFGLKDDPTPETAEDLVARIKAGKYILPEQSKKKYFYEPTRAITWRDPSVKEDQDGFDVAWKSFEAEFTKTKDTVMSGTPVDMAAAVQALEAWTSTTAN